jgi:hypothetical protein
MDVGRDLEELSASTSDMIGHHLKVARLEMEADLRVVLRKSAPLLVAMPLALAAFALLTGAAFSALSRVCSRELALLALGVAYGLCAALLFLMVKRVDAPARPAPASLAAGVDGPRAAPAGRSTP